MLPVLHIDPVAGARSVPPSFQKAAGGVSVRNPIIAHRVLSGAAETGAAMWDDLMALAVGAVFIPTIVVLGVFRLAALRRAKDLPQVRADEWAASHDLQRPQ